MMRNKNFHFHMSFSSITSTVSYIFILIFSVLPNSTFALSGLSENIYKCYYTKNIILKVGDPSDICKPIKEKSQNCFYIYESEDEKKYNLEALTEINIPENEIPSFIMGKSYIDDKWLIYNISQDTIVFRGNKELVLESWKSIQKTEPKFSNTNTLLEYFKETKDSSEIREEQNNMVLIIFITWIIIFVIFPISLIFLLVFLFRKIRKK